MLATTSHSNTTVPCDITISPEFMFASLMWYEDGIWQMAKEKNPGNIRYREENLKSKFNITPDNSLLILDTDVSNTGNYTCKISIQKNTEDGVIFSEENSTVEVLVQDVPEPPRYTTVIGFGSRQVIVSWSKPEEDNNSLVTYYEVQIRTSDQKWFEGRKVVVTADHSMTTIEELQPYTEYYIRVFSQNDIGISEPSPESVAFRTVSESPSIPLLGMQVVSTNSTINMSWESPPLKTHHGQLQGLEVQYKIVPGNTVNVVSVEDPDKQSILIEDLEPYRDYIVTIAAFNDAGKGPAAEISVRTLEGIPSKPRITRVSNMTDTSLYVSWEAPKILNGRIKSYELQWVHEKNNKTRIIHGHLANPMTAFISGLKPYTQYEIRVAASTNGGKGEFSDVFPALTDITGPSPPVIQNVTELSPTSVYVSWLPPEIIHRQLDSYIIQYFDVNKRGYPQKQLVVDGVLNEKVIEDLQSNTNYTLVIAGVTRSIFTSTSYVGDISESVGFELPSLEPMESADEGAVPSGVNAGAISIANGGFIMLDFCHLLFIIFCYSTCIYFRLAYTP
ncbi:hypothetical protein ScPMuIL_009334 [Solemya velum]